MPTTQANEFGAPFLSDGEPRINCLSGSLSQMIGPPVGFGTDVTGTSANQKRTQSLHRWLEVRLAHKTYTDFPATKSGHELFILLPSGEWGVPPIIPVEFSLCQTDGTKSRSRPSSGSLLRLSLAMQQNPLSILALLYGSNGFPLRYMSACLAISDGSTETLCPQRGASRTPISMLIIDLSTSPCRLANSDHNGDCTSLKRRARVCISTYTRELLWLLDAEYRCRRHHDLEYDFENFSD